MSYQDDRMEFLVRVAGLDRPIACVLCGDDDITHLTVGHINDDAQQRILALYGGNPPSTLHTPTITGNSSGGKSSLANMSFQVIKQLRKLLWPAEELAALQLECFNCNCSKRSTFRFTSDWDLNKIRAKAEGRIRDGLAEGAEARREPAGGEEDPVTGTSMGGEGTGGRDESTGGSVRGSDGRAADLDDRQRERIDSTDWGTPPCVLGQ